MASIDFREVSLDFPIYDADTRSLKSHLVKVATGGVVGLSDHGVVLVKALDSISFSLKDGDRIGLIGHNGAGKTTLLRVLSGAYFPTGGDVIMQGEIGSLINISLGISPEATGRENIHLRGSLLGMSSQTIKDNLDDIIEFAELGGFLDMPIRTYSSGMHLRLAFAIATVVRPEILIMDEWLSVGDEGFKARAEERLNNMIQSTNILVIASHSKQLIERVCNRVIWLEHGKIKMDGAPELVLNEYFR
jgi:lipopolysaccharide transport system ATP-binding protein